MNLYSPYKQCLAKKILIFGCPHLFSYWHFLKGALSLLFQKLRVWWEENSMWRGDFEDVRDLKLPEFYYQKNDMLISSWAWWPKRNEWYPNSCSIKLKAVGHALQNWAQLSVSWPMSPEVLSFRWPAASSRGCAIVAPGKYPRKFRLSDDLLRPQEGAPLRLLAHIPGSSVCQMTCCVLKRVCHCGSWPISPEVPSVRWPAASSRGCAIAAPGQYPRSSVFQMTCCVLKRVRHCGSWPISPEVPSVRWPAASSRGCATAAPGPYSRKFCPSDDLLRPQEGAPLRFLRFPDFCPPCHRCHCLGHHLHLLLSSCFTHWHLWIPIYNYSCRKFIYVSILKPRR